MPARIPFHYGWVIVATAFISIMAALGLGRFSLGMLIPTMAIDLSLNNSQTGLIGTINFIGYLVSVLMVGKLSKKYSARTLIPAALFLVSLSMICVSQAKTFYLIAFFYLFTGAGSGIANVMTMALILRWFSRKESGRACGLVVGGSGLAILATGRFVPIINSIYGVDGWRHNWFYLGLAVMVIALCSLMLIRNSPLEAGLKPYSKTNSAEEDSHKDDQAGPKIISKNICQLGLIYFCFGFTYVVYATFLVSTMLQEMFYSEAQAGLLWSWVGILSLFSGPIFGTLSDKLGRKWVLVIVFCIQTISYLLVAAKLDNLLFISIFLFGITAWSIPSIMTAAVGDYVGPNRAAQVFGFITFIFGIGQISGPFIAGFMADKMGSFSYSFLMAAALTAIASAVSSLLNKPPSTAK